MTGMSITVRVCLLLVTVTVLISCTSSEEDDVRGDVTSFCDVAVPLLSEQVTFPGEGPMRNQLSAIETAATTHLSDGAQLALVNSVDDLDRLLALAVAGEAEGGWASYRVVDNVAGLCGTDNDMISWSVQP